MLIFGPLPFSGDSKSTKEAVTSFGQQEADSGQLQEDTQTQLFGYFKPDSTNRFRKSEPCGAKQDTGQAREVITYSRTLKFRSVWVVV